MYLRSCIVYHNSKLINVQLNWLFGLSKLHYLRSLLSQVHTLNFHIDHEILCMVKSNDLMIVYHRRHSIMWKIKNYFKHIQFIFHSPIIKPQLFQFQDLDRCKQ